MLNPTQECSHSRQRALNTIATAALGLSALVVVLGAYTRLVDAGLGCPDWPGCYGYLTIPQSESEIAQSELAFPDAPVEPAKAWTEMVHRYFASLLGLLILALPILAWRTGTRMVLPCVLAVLVVVQGAMGALTVTLKLWPQVVTAHLLGGFATLALLFHYTLTLRPEIRWRVPAGVSFAIHVTLAALLLQVALGGWVSSNYAALACPDFPLCHGVFVPDMDFRNGFNLFQGIGPNYLGGEMSSEARIAIQISHRVGALVVLGLSLWVSWMLTGAARWTVAGIVTIQFLLGIGNVLLDLPLALAVMHNAGAAALLLALIAGRASAPEQLP